MEITITQRKGPRQLADVELHFLDGPLAGLALGGFTIWRRGSRYPSLAVTFPAREYPMAGGRGARRIIPILRGTKTGHDRLRDLILAAYADEQP